MNTTTNNELAEYAYRCDNWFTNIFSKLSDSDRTEFIRSYRFFCATKYQYEQYLDDVELHELNKKNSIRNSYIGFFILFAVAGLLDSFDGWWVKSIFIYFLIFSFFESSIRKIEERIFRTQILQIERDFYSMDISLRDTANAIRKDKKFEKIYENENSSDEEKEKCRLDKWVTDLKFKESILTRITSGEYDESFPIS
jgi:hypothetical protein